MKGLEIAFVFRGESELLASHTFLLGLTSLRGSKLLDLLGGIDLVTHSVEDVLLFILLLINSGSRSLSLDPVVSRGGKVTVSHSPNFSTD